MQIPVFTNMLVTQVLMMKKSRKETIYSWKFCLYLHFSVQRPVLVQPEQSVDIYEDKKRM